jgi:hypothetical protein
MIERWGWRMAPCFRHLRFESGIGVAENLQRIIKAPPGRLRECTSLLNLEKGDSLSQIEAKHVVGLQA